MSRTRKLGSLLIPRDEKLSREAQELLAEYKKKVEEFRGGALKEDREKTSKPRKQKA